MSPKKTVSKLYHINLFTTIYKFVPLSMALRVHLLSLKKLFHMLMSRIPLCPSLPRSCCGHPPGPCCCCHSHPTTFHCTSSRPPTKTALLAGAAAHHMYQLLYNNIQPAYSSPDPSRPTKHPAYLIISIITIVFISRAIQ